VETGNIDLRVTGLERIPAEDGFLLCGNHQGMFDILAIVAAFDRPIAAVLKKELKDIPFIKQIIACTHSYPMDREDVRQSMQVIMAVTKELKKGRNILIFPEGTRSKKGNRMMDFHGGTFKCVIQSKCPIVPFALVDSYKVMDQKHSDPVTVHLEFLDPIYYEEYAELKTVEIAELVRGRIEESIDRVLEK
jgi:1-acyl-sn-glycerol-3-phosphate acyltransferase